MCTLSWRSGADGLHVWFSRDEQRSRALAEPPTLHSSGSHSWLAPLDPVGGGTWMAVNDAGMVLTLLNRYDVPSFPGATSRGRVIPSLVEAASLEDVQLRVEAASWEGYAPFALLALQDGEVLRWDWDGFYRETRPTKMPVTTCSVRTAEIEATRRHYWQSLGALPGAPRHEAFHDWQNDHDPAVGVRMDRLDARTVSLTHAQVGPEEIRLTYRARAVDQRNFEEPVTTVLKRCDALSRR